MKFKSIYKLKTEINRLRSNASLGESWYDESIQIKLLKEVVELIDKKIKKIKREPLVNQPKIRVVVLEKLKQEIKGEKE